MAKLLVWMLLASLWSWVGMWIFLRKKDSDEAKSLRYCWNNVWGLTVWVASGDIVWEIFVCGKLWDGPWVGIGGCISVMNGTFGLCGVFAGYRVSETGTRVWKFGSWVSVFGRSLGIWGWNHKWEPTDDCDRHNLKGECEGKWWCGVVTESVLGLVNYVCPTAYFSGE